MGKRFDVLLFPGGKSKAFTLSYDDGVIQDRRLAALFRQHGVKCTFNLNAAHLDHQEIIQTQGGEDLDISKISPAEIETVYQTHEIGGHGLYHSALDSIGAPLAMYEIIEDKQQLEMLAGKPLKMFAYPFGRYNTEVSKLLMLAGYRGARTVMSTHAFDLPKDFMAWNPTCHHNDPQLMELAKEFVESDSFAFAPRLFFLWGHAYEFDGDNNWDRMEDFLQMISGHEETIWYAANGEIIDYVSAYQRLEYSADGSMIFNPSAIDITIQAAREPVVLPAGQLTRMPATPL